MDDPYRRASHAEKRRAWLTQEIAAVLFPGVNEHGNQAVADRLLKLA